MNESIPGAVNPPYTDTPDFLRQQISEKDGRINILHEQNTALRNEVGRLARAVLADSGSDIADILRAALEGKGDIGVAVRSNDDEIHIFIEGLTLDESGEIVQPVREYIVEGTLTVPVSFRVSAASHEDARELADEAMNELSHDAEMFVDDFTATEDGVSDFRGGQVEAEVDHLAED